ncbi:MAG: Lrp/AsnC ligand binding domain-containing protein [Deltaproteobacteria bacterium]|nr:Lrp/AsnC ligand binding domain-containing protein [Deltaproteobacteria bacterium]
MAVGAYVLVEAAQGKAGEIVRRLRRTKGVKEARAVTGPYDVVAYVEAADITRLGTLVTGSIQKVGGVTRTLTCVTVDL